MTEWISCPKCRALMIGLTGGHICPLCGYRVPAQIITTTTGTSVEYVPVIRCKDCKYAKPIDSEWLECQHDKRVMKVTGFCSMAEPKEEKR